MTKNRLIVLQMAGLAPVIRDVMQRFNQRNTKNPRDWDGPLLRHQCVTEALHAGDPDQAMAAMTAHFALAEVAIHEIYQRKVRKKQNGPRHEATRPRKKPKQGGSNESFPP
jgi:DNA-binding FadR family transcriptional regulator